MNIIAIIPARSGSKRMPRKNALEIETGKNLTQQAIDCAVDSGVISQTIVLTDDIYLRFERAHLMTEPSEFAGDHCDISDAVAHAVERVENSTGRVDMVVTLQPAVIARSPLIVKQIVLAMQSHGAGGAVTAARTVPWQWSMRNSCASNAWYPGRYPRSQDSGHHLCEINAVQVSTRQAALAGKRWELPLLLAELPPWAAALDIDDHADLAMARDMWPWAKTRLETWDIKIHRAESINGYAS